MINNDGFAFACFSKLDTQQKSQVKSLQWTLFSDKMSIYTSDFEGSIVAYKEGKPIAMICLEKMEEEIYIYHFEVLEKRKGYGTSIINKFKTVFKNDFERIRVDCKDGLSCEFWKSLGFKESDNDLIFEL